jgi:hypothetical protein
VFIPVGQEAGGGLLQAGDAGKAAPANGLAGDQRETSVRRDWANEPLVGMKHGWKREWSIRHGPPA